MYSARTEPIGRRIAKALDARNMRPADLAAMTGIPKSSLSLYLKGSYEPKGDRIYIIAKALRVSESWLMGYDVPMEKQEENNPSEQQLDGVDKELFEALKQMPKEQKLVLLSMIRGSANTPNKD